MAEADAKRARTVCSLKSVDVRKGDNGDIQLLVTTKEGRRSIKMTKAEAMQVMADIEIAFQVARAV